MAFVEVKNLSREYNGSFRLRNNSFELEKGETLTLMGPSGSGKSSLLRNICGLDLPDSGSVVVNGRDVTYAPTAKRRIGLIFQDLAIFPHMTVYDNIAYGLRSRRMAESDVSERVEELSEMLGIHGLLDRFPGQVSGGQRQRVALCRSVAPSPDLLLLDEPMSSLDLQLRSSLRSVFKSFARKMELTMIYVTHDHSEGLFMGDKTGVIYDGSIERISSPEEMFLHPLTSRNASFFGYNIVTVSGERIAFYPTDFKVEPEGGDLEGRVISVGFEGNHVRVHLSSGIGETFQLEFPPGGNYSRLAVGDSLNISLERPEIIS